MAKIITDEAVTPEVDVQVTEGTDTATETPEERAARLERRAQERLERRKDLPNYDPAIVGTATQFLRFEGAIGNGKSLADAVIEGKTVKKPKIVGYAFSWHGEEPLEVFADRLQSANAKKTLLSLALKPEKVQVQPGETFYLTLPATAELLGRAVFAGRAHAGVIADKMESPEDEVTITVNTKGVTDNPFEAGISLSHVSAQGAKQKQAIKKFVINLFDKHDEETGKAADGAQLRPEFVETFGAVLSRPKRVQSATGKTRSLNEEALKLSNLFNVANAQ